MWPLQQHVSTMLLYRLCSCATQYCILLARCESLVRDAVSQLNVVSHRQQESNVTVLNMSSISPRLCGGLSNAPYNKWISLGDDVSTFISLNFQVRSKLYKARSAAPSQCLRSLRSNYPGSPHSVRKAIPREYNVSASSTFSSCTAATPDVSNRRVCEHLAAGMCHRPLPCRQRM